MTDTPRPPMTRAEIAAARERCRVDDVPPCPVCGEPRDLGAAGGGVLTWRCSSLTLENHIPSGKPGWRERLDHYQASLYEQRLPDSDLPRALDTLEQALEMLEESVPMHADCYENQRDVYERVYEFLRQVEGEKE